MTKAKLEREAFQAFLDANEAEEVVTTAMTLFRLVAADKILGLDRFHLLAKELPKFLSFRQKQIFKLLSSQVHKRDISWENYVTDPKLESNNIDKTKDFEVLVSGAGPCGFRTAVECLLLGMKVTIVEKRVLFSRVNILTLWQQTMDDLVALGAKFFYPMLRTKDVDKQSKLHMGTREMQLCMLKTFLLLGGTMKYGVELKNIRSLAGFHKSNVSEERKKYAGICLSASDLNPAESVLKFNPDRSDNYDATFKCNMKFSPDIDHDIFVPYISAHEISTQVSPLAKNEAIKKLKHYSMKETQVGVSAIEFDALILAEGEWSPNSMKLGVDKVVDKFKKAIGIVVNLDFDPTNKKEKLKELNVSKINADWRNSPLKDINNYIDCENVEYLRGSTHYIVITASLHSLVQEGVVVTQYFEPLLDASNVDIEKLYTLARVLATKIGLPESTPFTSRNPVQIFDFSARARAVSSHFFIKSHRSAMEGIQGHKEDAQSVYVGSKVPQQEEGELVVPVMPIGDTLFEPFWPQGLGSNRGFHGAMDAAFSLKIMWERGIEEGSKERNFSYVCMNQSGWRNSYAVNEYQMWDVDPINRYLPDALRDSRESKKVEIPSRFMDVDFKMRKDSILRGVAEYNRGE